MNENILRGPYPSAGSPANGSVKPTYPMQQYNGAMNQYSQGGCGCGGNTVYQQGMMQDNGCTDDCGCNDYALLTANTGIVTISTANALLDGTGTLGTVITAASNGTIVRSITIKATQSVRAGMVRLFLNKGGAGNFLIKEIPIPECPTLAATPTPPPVLPVFEIRIPCNIELRSTYILKASTQNAESFNIIAEGLDFAYPGTLPDTCCNFKQNTANNGVSGVSTANTNLNGTGTIAAIYTAGGAGSTMNGSKIKRITVKALQNTHQGMVRLFISNNAGTTYYLYKEIYIPETAPSAYMPSFEYVLDECFHLKKDYIIGASTEKAESFAITIEGDDWKYPIS